MILSCYQHDDKAIKIHLRVTPNSSRNDICGVIADEFGQQMLKIKITAQPEDGKANKALIKFLAKHWDIKVSDIEIISGETSRNKKVVINNSPKILEKLKIITNTLL